MLSRIALALLFAATLAIVTPARAADTGCFRIFDATGYKNKPDLERYGIQVASVIYTTQHYWPNRQTLEQLPPKTLVESTVRRRVAADRSPPLVIIDLEHWPNVGDDSVVADTQSKYVTLAQWTKASAAGSAVGYYGVAPLRDYWRAIKDPASSEYRKWQAENDRFKELATTVDVLAPSLYTFYDDVEGWKRYAAENIKEARRLAPDKPIYPFIWPQYHESNRKLGSRYVPATYWLQQLQTLASLADGAIIWAPPGWWDDSAPWWLATRSFIETSPRTTAAACH